MQHTLIIIISDKYVNHSLSLITSVKVDDTSKVRRAKLQNLYG